MPSRPYICPNPRRDKKKSIIRIDNGKKTKIKK